MEEREIQWSNLPLHFHFIIKNSRSFSNNYSHCLIIGNYSKTISLSSRLYVRLSSLSASSRDAPF